MSDIPQEPAPGAAVVPPEAAAAVTEAAAQADVAEQAVGATATPAPAVPELTPAQCSAKLAALFPALFGLQQPLPLKLRIQADIQARAPGLFTRKSLSPFLHRYTTGTPYLQALARVPQRYDLDGQPAGDVAAEHRDAAVAEVARRRALMDARRAAEQAARREAQNAERAAHRADEDAARAARREADSAARVQRDADNSGRRERSALLRAFETSTLTRANFCALKRVTEADLEAQLVLARQEAAERPLAMDEHRGPPRHERGARRPRPGP